jgi:uncharacterized protein DUF4296
MLKYNRLLFSLLLFVTACVSHDTPKDVLDQKTMTSLLTELHIIDGSLYTVMQVPDTLYKYGHGKFLVVFKKYHTDSVQFKKSMQYYCNRPDLLQTIYQTVGDNIKQKNDSLTKANQKQIEAENKKRTDSLRKLQKIHPPVPPRPDDKRRMKLDSLKKNAVPVK